LQHNKYSFSQIKQIQRRSH